MSLSVYHLVPGWLRIASLMAGLAVSAFREPAPDPLLQVYLIGDSTMASKAPTAYPETGWGMPFAYFFDSTVAVDNRAQNGCSTQSFRQQGRWQPVLAALRPGDYVFIQFGHNDEVPTKAVCTTETEFTTNLARYVVETRSRQAIPVLLTPAARRRFDAAGRVEDTHAAYAPLVRAVARAQQVPLIDLSQTSQELLQQFGPETSRLLYNYLTPGEHPNYPAGRADDTHFSELGARRMAELVLADLRRLPLPLAARVRNGPVPATVNLAAQCQLYQR